MVKCPILLKSNPQDEVLPQKMLSANQYLTILPLPYQAPSNGPDYGGTQIEASRESRIHMRGAILGLSLAGYAPEWHWHVAEIGTAHMTGVDVASSTFEKINPLDATNGGHP